MNELIDKALSEYGLFVGFLLFSVYVLYKRNIDLSDKSVEAIKNSTKVLVEIKTLIKEKFNVK